MPSHLPSVRWFCRRLQPYVLLLVGLALALRALAVPLELTAHQEKPPAQTALSAQAAPAAYDVTVAQAGAFVDSSCHDANTASAQEKSPDTRVCQILCAVVGSPLLFNSPAPLAQGTIDASYGTPLPLSLGVAQPPDHPPPIV